MKARDEAFTKIIDGRIQFVIPVFQRDYSWTDLQCEQLWSDILKVGSGASDRKHFMGSVVYAPAGGTAASLPRWLLIDGQQRLTTLTLLLIALRKHLLETNWKPPNENGPTPARIEAYFLKNLQEEGDRQHKLVLRRQDHEALRTLLEGGDAAGFEGSRIAENHDFFRGRVAEADPTVVYDGIARLVVVDVTLDSHDDPQMIFESLNATGLGLSEADKIRNYVLMRLPEPEQTRLYATYWSKIENLFQGAAGTFDSFARDYMALQTGSTKQVRAEDVYRAFRDFFVERGSQGLDALLADMLRFARYYAAFSLARDAPKALAAPLARLNRLADTAATLVMRLSDLHHRVHALSETDFAAALELLESYVFRRAVCGMQTRGYWQVFANLAHRPKEKDPLTSLKVELRRRHETNRFPSDEEFERELQLRDIYAMRTCHYMLDRLENHENKEPTDTTGFTVEHVLPQNEDLPKAWRVMLGEGWKEIHATWLHRLGNITLTGYNSSYSDRSFEDKKSTRGGFNESSVRLNKFIREQGVWTAREIETRGRELATRALAIWTPLVVSEDEVKAAAKAELKERAGRQDVTKVAMSETARRLFDLLRPQIRDLDPDIIEMAETRSVSYHAPEYFLEVLPRERRLVLLLNLDFSECESKDGATYDAHEWRFLAHAKYSGGVIYRLNGEGSIAQAMRLVRQAHKLAHI